VLAPSYPANCRIRYDMVKEGLGIVRKVFGRYDQVNNEQEAQNIFTTNQIEDRGKSNPAHQHPRAMPNPQKNSEEQNSPSNPIWWIPGLGIGIATVLLIANGWVAWNMTSQFREYANIYLRQQAVEGLMTLAQEESQLIGFAAQSLARGRSKEDLLSEAFSILFDFDLAACFDANGDFLEGYTYTNQGRATIAAGTPLHQSIQEPSMDRGRRPVSYRFVRHQNQIIILYAVSDPRGFEPHTFFFGRTLPNEYSKLSDTSELMWRVVPSTLEQPDIIDSWDLSTSTQIEEGRDREDHRRPPPFDGFERPRRGGPPGGPRGGPGGGRREFTPPLASSVMQQGVSLSANHITLEDGKTKSLAFSTLNDPEAQESVRIEFLLSREFPETIESTIRSISRNSVGAGLLIVMFTMIVLSEMRRRRKAEATLTDRNQLLDEANHRKDRLLAIISHDLRAPLSGVSNLSGLLMKAPESFTPEEIRKFAGEIQSTSKHLTELLDNLLNWARLQTGQLPYFPGRIDLERVAHQVTTLFASAAKEQDVRLNTLVEKHPAFVNDIEMLRTILRNLLSNAIRHSHKGGDVMLRCEQVDNKMRIDVKDTGEGMTASQVAALFQLPDKPRDPTEVGKTGAGFGLVLSKKLAHRMGGDLVVQSEPGTGSTFRLEVPMQWTPEGFKDDKPSEGQKPSTAS
jgi:signal transduction histidine kinase